MSKLSFVLSLLTFHSFVLSSWTDYYPEKGILPDLYGYNQVDQYKTIASGNFYIFKVIFSTIHETQGKGGAIYVTTPTNLLVESSSFIKCHSTGEGGAIEYLSSNGRCFLKKLCSTGCYSSRNFGHFGTCLTKKSEECTCSMDYTSVANLYSRTSYHTNIYLHGSDIVIYRHDNFSKNDCPDKPAIFSEPTIKAYVLYTSIQNNTATTGRIVCTWTNKEKNIDFCNIIGNSASNLGIIHGWGPYKISNSCLIENVGAMFVFENRAGTNTCTLFNCTIDNTNKYDSYGEVIINGSSIAQVSFINDLDNDGCFSINDKKMSIKTCKTYLIKGDRCSIGKQRLILEVI